MTEAKQVAHTPGPWLPCRDGSVEGPSGQTIFRAGRGVSIIDAQRNAAIAAAAPDLLAALQMMVEWFEQDNPEPAHDEIMAARAALSKAGAA